MYKDDINIRMYQCLISDNNGDDGDFYYFVKFY